MKTKLIYYKDAYKKSLTANVVKCWGSNNLTNVILDQTIFYPEGGGQPCDVGTFEKDSHFWKVEYVRYVNGEIVHQIERGGKLAVGDKIECKLNWPWRHKYMRIHTAGHVLHDALITLYPNIKPISGSHGKKAYLRYEGGINPADKQKIEDAANKLVSKNLEVITREASIDELKKAGANIPPNLPTTKAIRMIQIGKNAPMPDGGVHVKSIAEIGKIWIAGIQPSNKTTTIRYGVA